MICERITRGVPVRVSGVVLRDGKILLVAHRKRKETYWLLPGGGVEHGESLPDALRREFIEELGVTVDSCNFAFLCDAIAPGGKRHILNVVFRCEISDENFRMGKDKRLHRYGFFGPEEVAVMTIHPPLNDALVSMMECRLTESYLGRLWRE